MGGVRGDALGGVGDEGVGEALGQHLLQKGLGLDDAGVDDHGHALLIGHGGDEIPQVRVGHFPGDGGVPQQAAENGQGRVEGVQAGAHLHALHGVDGVPAGEQHPGLLQGRAARGEVILDDQVLGLLRVHKGGDVGVLPCHLDVHPLPTIGGQSFLDALVGPGGDFVNHAPGERKLLLGPGVGFGGHVAGGFPGVQHREKALPQLLPVLGAVVHGHQGQGGAAGFKPGQAAGCQGAQQRLGLPGGAAHVLLHGGVYGVALLRDGEGHHLQAGGPEDFLHPAAVLGQGQALGDGAHHFLLHGAVGQQADGEGQVVVRAQKLGDGVGVVGLAAEDAGVRFPGVEQPLGQHRREGPEQVARPKVQPGGLLAAVLHHGLPVVLGQRVAGQGLGQNSVVQLHRAPPVLSPGGTGPRPGAGRARTVPPP